MKNANVKKINTIGKVARVLAIILIVIVSIGIVCCIIGGIAVNAIPADAVKASGTCSATIDVDETGLPGNSLIKLIEPGTLIDIAETSFRFNEFGLHVDWNVDKNDRSDGIYSYSIDGTVEGGTGKAVTVALSVGLFASALILATVLIACIFGKKLADKLSKCDSPFEEGVIKAMKIFAFSLIPFAVLALLESGIGILTVLFTLVIILFVYIFAYGAELQRESDETL